MATLQWRPELLLNVAEIDRQHREVVDCASRLSAAISEGQAQEQLRPMLSALIAFAEMHFACEEAMMLAHAFDGHAAHKSEHQKLLKQIYLVDKDLASGCIGPSQVLALFVQVWIDQHILSFDRQFAEFLKSKGVD